MHPLTPGRQGRAEQTVAPDQTAAALGSGSLPVLGTPALLALMETAAVDALAPLLPPETTSVGVYVELHHLAATPVGGRVHAEATLSAVEGRTLTFEITAYDAQEQIGKALHRRVLVESARFMRRVEGKENS
jgi:predicted thioesterase